MLLPDTESTTVSPNETELATILAANEPELGLLSLTDDSGLRTLDLGGVVPTRYVAWRPPTGDELVFLGHPGGIQTDLGLYVVRPDGTGLRQVALAHGESIDAATNPAQSSFQDLVLSDDGVTAAYVNRGSKVAGKDCVIHLLDLDSGVDRAMSFDPTAHCEVSPVFLGDGRLILESRDDPAGNARLLVAPADASASGRQIGPVFDVSDTREGRHWELSPDRGTVLFLRTDGVTELISVATGAVRPTDVRITVGDWSWQRIPETP